MQKVIYALYAAIILCTGSATIIEKIKGTTYVGEHIYGAWWFAMIWAVLAVATMVALVRKRIYRRAAPLVLHLSFIVILAGAALTYLTAERRTINLRKGKITTLLPYTLKLKDFKVVCYPGTDAPLDYQSIIETPKGDIIVSMNNIGDIDGYRLYLSSYDSDSQGVSFGVYHDPWGIATTYTGYIMFFIGIVMTMLSKTTHIRTLYRKAMKALLPALLLCCTIDANAEEVRTVDSDIAHRFGKVCILYNDRICPVNTAATDFVTKLAGAPTWNGLSADEIFISWMIYYSPWEEQRIIRIKSKDVQEILGIDSQWASFGDFIDEYGEYKLAGHLKDVREGKGHTDRKALLEADEKYHIVEMFYNSQMLKMFPYIHKGKTTWYTPVNQVLPREMPVKEQFFIKRAMDFLAESVVTGQKRQALETIAKIELFQREKAGGLLPSKATVNAEVFYNVANAQRWLAYLALAVSIFVCMAFLASRKETESRWFRLAALVFVVTLMAYLTMLFILRWWISGHIPVSNGYETMQFMALVQLVITVMLHRRFPIMTGFGTMVAGFCMLVATLAGGSPKITPLMPVLQSPLLSLHVMTVMCAYALFALQVLLGIQALWQLHRNRQTEADSTTALSQLILYPAVFLLGTGIFLGAVWANVSWGAYWTWDPKETWALIAFMIYSVPIHCASIRQFRSLRFYNLYVICAFLTVIITYFGVNCLLGGMHSYA